MLILVRMKNVKDVLCTYCKVILVTLAANYDTCNFIALLYGQNLEGKQFFVDVGVTKFRDHLEKDCYQLRPVTVKEIRCVTHSEAWICKSRPFLYKRRFMLVKFAIVIGGAGW